MSAVDPAARFQVDPVPINAPGNCFLCKGNKHGPFIRTGLFHDFYKEQPDASRDGDVYICSACVGDMANTLELHSGITHTMLREKEKEGYNRGILAALKGFYKYVHSSDGIFVAAASSLAIPDGNDSENDGETEQSIPRGSKKADKAPKQNGKSASGKGPDDSPSDRIDAFLT